jgi:hypothetical protein
MKIGRPLALRSNWRTWIAAWVRAWVPRNNGLDSRRNLAMYSCELTIDLSDNVEADIEVTFWCTYPGYGGDYYNPPEPPDFCVKDVWVTMVYGKTYDREPGSWRKELDTIADSALHGYGELYDHMLDSYHAAKYE